MKNKAWHEPQGKKFFENVENSSNLDPDKPKYLGYLTQRNKVVEAVLTITKNLINQGNNNIQVLEAGCGNGFLARKISRYAKYSGYRITINCFDDSPKSLGQGIEDDFWQIVRKRNTDLGVDPILASLSKIPLDPESQNIITCVGVLPYVDETEFELFANEACRVLKSGGKLIVSGVDVESIAGTDRGWIKIDQIGKTEAQYKETYRDIQGEGFETPVWERTTNQLKQVFGRAGLILEEEIKIPVTLTDIQYPAVSQGTPFDLINRNQVWGQDHGYTGFKMLIFQKK